MVFGVCYNKIPIYLIFYLLKGLKGDYINILAKP